MSKTNYIVIILFFTFFALNSQPLYFRCGFREDPSNSITIGWSDYDSLSLGKLYFGDVDYGANPLKYNKIQNIDISYYYAGLYHHFVRLKGLKPNTVYYFIVNDNKYISNRYSFKTLSDDPDIPLMVISGGDSRDCVSGEFESELCRTRRQNANKMVAKLRADFICFSGDFVYYDYYDIQWQNWLADWELTISKSGRLTPFVPIKGNHESNDALLKLFDCPPYYVINPGGNLLRVYCINSELYCDKSMMTWFENDLKKHTGTAEEPYWKIVQYHYALMPHAEYYPQDALIECWTPLFQKYNIKLAMEAHCHVQKITYPIIHTPDTANEKGFIRDDEKGTVYIGEGGWGAPWRPLYTFYDTNHAYSWTMAQARFTGFNILNITKKSLEIRTIRTDSVHLASEVNDNAPPCTLAEGLFYWQTPEGNVVTLKNSTIKDISKTPEKILIKAYTCNNKLNIIIPELKENLELFIYNIIGQPVKIIKLPTGSRFYQTDIHKLPAGIFLLRFKNKDLNQLIKIIIYESTL